MDEDARESLALQLEAEYPVVDTALIRTLVWEYGVDRVADVKSTLDYLAASAVADDATDFDPSGTGGTRGLTVDGVAEQEPGSASASGSLSSASATGGHDSHTAALRPPASTLASEISSLSNGVSSLDLASGDDNDVNARASSANTAAFDSASESDQVNALADMFPTITGRV